LGFINHNTPIILITHENVVHTQEVYVAISKNSPAFILTEFQ